MKLKPGNVVRVKGIPDAPRMTVEKVRKNTADCVWYDGRFYQREPFVIKTLKKVEK